VAEGYENFDGSHADRDGRERVGVALVSRFIGAVFLVLLGGLLLLDRSLLRANQDQLVLDAESSALLVESYIGGQAAVVEQIADAMRGVPARSEGVPAQPRLARLVKNIPGLHYAWSTGERGLESVGTDVDSAVQRIREQHSGVTASGLTITLIPTPTGHVQIVLAQHETESAASVRVTGIVIDASPIESLLTHIRPTGRISLAIMSGNDTIALVGHPRLTAAAMPPEQKVIRLPTGGTWTASAVHAMTTRSLRWALWAVGVTGVFFLALGLLREQRRVTDAASRSSELERLYRDVKRANQAKSEFLANVSHELRTPLNAIVGFVELLREGFYGDLSPRQVLPVDRIAASATHLRHLVDQVLDIAKIAAGRLEVHPESIVLRPFVLNTASELESLVSEKGLVFSISVGASLPRVRTDPTHLRQILINLIGNAVKYTPAGTISVRARLIEWPVHAVPRKATQARPSGAASPMKIRPPANGAWVALQVVDTGMGIAAVDLERIFDEFEQVNAGPRGDSMQRGTGLGLAISRRLARLLGGEVGVESTAGQGSTFTIWLPVNAADLTLENGHFTPPDAPRINA
jgi:signal transduction histidine kinase